MHLDSDDIRVLLWGAFGVMLSLSFVSQLAPLTVLGTVLVLSALGYWLFAHPADLGIRYEIVKARFQKSTGLGPKWPFLFWVNLTVFFLFGLSMVYFAYALSMEFHEPRRFLFKFVREAFGVEGYIFSLTLLGVYAMEIAVETVLGRHVRRPR